MSIREDLKLYYSVVVVRARSRFLVNPKRENIARITQEVTDEVPVGQLLMMALDDPSLAESNPGSHTRERPTAADKIRAVLRDRVHVALNFDYERRKNEHSK